MNSAFYCAIYQVLAPALEIVRKCSLVNDQAKSSQLSAVIEESYMKQDPQILTKSLRNQSLIDTQLSAT